MKKIILVAVVVVSVSSAHAGSYHQLGAASYTHALRNNSPIPQACIEAYNAMFPGATTLKWARKGEGVYQVTFLLNGQKSTARFSYTGVYLGK